MPSPRVQSVPPATAQRRQMLRAVLQPGVRLWIDQRAGVEARRSVHDLAALRWAICVRFSGSLAALSRRPGTNGALVPDAAVEAMLFLLLMQTLNSGYDLLPNPSNVSAAQAQIRNNLYADSDLSDQVSVGLQVLMDSGADLLQVASYIEKTLSGSAAAMVQNIKT